MKKDGIIAIITVLICFNVCGIIACKPAVTYDEAAVRAYADPATETTLQGLSESNLDKYTQYGNAEFKAAVTQEMLDDKLPQINSKFGTYVSKDFVGIGEYGDYIIVYYRATYTKSEVVVRMVFDQDHLVAGQWFE